ncbi:MAG: hypothetical protein ABJE66_38215 [Deltaproteobacteria bacterium]
MRLPTLLACLTVSASLYAVACRSDDNNTPSDGQGSNNGSGNFVKIQQVQDEAMAPGTAVNLHDVVVTAIDNFGAKVGDIWVEEKEGGKRSGVHVFKASLTDVAMLSIGDEIDLKGAIKTEFALTGSGGDSTGRTDTELEPASGGQITITKLGMSTTITPDKVDALAIGQLYDSTMSATGGGTAFTNAWEDWEGVLVELDNVSAQGAAKAFGKTVPTPADSYALGITGVAKLEGTMADITMSNIARATCFSKVTGVVDYFFDYLVLPRSTSDFATGGTSCPAAESVCTDSIDNDGNGFTDCKDNGCIVNTASCRSTTTINALDTAATLPTTGQEIGSTESVCVTAIGFNGQDFWVSAGPGVAGANKGLYVFAAGTPIPSGLAVGSKVDVIGTPQAFKVGTTGGTLLEFGELAATVQTGACAVTPALAQTAANLTQAANGKPMVGSLVQMTNVAVVTVGDSTNHGAGSLKKDGTTFEYQSDILAAYLPATEVAKCYASVTGIWNYDVYTNVYSIELLAAGTGTGTCN